MLSTRKLALDKWNTRTRAQYINTEFFCVGFPTDLEKGLEPISPGRGKVRRIVNNEFICVRLNDGGALTTNCENNDIAYAMGEVRVEEEYVFRIPG